MVANKRARRTPEQIEHIVRSFQEWVETLPPGEEVGFKPHDFFPSFPLPKDLSQNFGPGATILVPDDDPLMKTILAELEKMIHAGKLHSVKHTRGVGRGTLEDQMWYLTRSNKFAEAAVKAEAKEKVKEILSKPPNEWTQGDLWNLDEADYWTKSKD